MRTIVHSIESILPCKLKSRPPNGGFTSYAERSIFNRFLTWYTPDVTVIFQYSTKKRQHFSHTESFSSSDTRQSMKHRIATERKSKIYTARCGYTWLDESNWPQEWPISPINIIYLKIASEKI